MDQDVKRIVDSYYDNVIGRREFVRLMTAATGSFAGAVAAARAYGLDLLKEGQVDENDSDLKSEMITYESSGHDGKQIPLRVVAYLTQPKAKNNSKGIVVIHENRGLNNHIKDVARRLAKLGYMTLAPDMLYASGGTEKMPDQDAAVKAIGKLNLDQVAFDFVKGAEHLKSAGKVKTLGCVGFCWGGAQSFLLACNSKDIAAAAVFYGRCPGKDKIKNLQAAVLGNFAEKDFVNDTIPPAEEALKELKKTYQFHYYKAQHAFHNDTAPGRYNKEAAELAWKRTLEWFDKHLKA